ncbi:MAG: hypothetical protein E6J69_12470 [Deltaproteobacteria bacterium]|nr:MAG: hypothetical protein E6J69_12470 [Deltaproteobacteria bacterium]
MRMTRATLLGVAALGILAGGALAAAPYDFTGHWTGGAQERGKSAVTLTADFAASGAKTFTGTIVATGDDDKPGQCPVTGRAKRRLNVSMHGTCDDGGTLNLHGRVNPNKQTIAGTFVEKRKGRRHRGTFTLGAAGTALKGAVLAPTASLATLQRRSFVGTMLARLIPGAYAQSSGLVPVPNANILVFTIDNSGRPTSTTPIAKTTSDSNGSYSLTLPRGTNLGSNLLIQASNSTTPAPVGGAGQQCSCPATQTTLDLSPISEYATRALIAALASNSSTLANYTPGEINAIIAKVTTLARDPSLVGTTIQDTITNITNAIDPAIQDDLRNAATPGEASVPQGLGGTYNFVSFSADDTGTRLSMDQQSGTVNVDVSAKTFSHTGPKSSVNLDEVCSADQNTPCNRSFTRNASSATKSGDGSISLLGGNQLLFQPSNGSEGALGFYNSSGDVIVLAAGDGLIVAFKQASSAPTLGGSYHGVQLDGSLSDSFTVAQGNPFNLGEASTGVNDPVTISGGTVSGTNSRNVLSKDITCNGGASCSYTETVSGSTGGGSFSAPVSVDATGALTVSPSGEAAHEGAVSADGNLFAFVDGDPVGHGDAGIVIGVKQGSGMTNASLNGSYGFVSYEFGLGPGSRSLQGQSGSVNLDGSGGLTANLAGTQLRVSTGCSGGFCPGTVVGQNSKTESPNTTYSVTATGGVTIAGSNGTISGFASPDGSVLVFTETHDGSGQNNDIDSQRGLFVMLK